MTDPLFDLKYPIGKYQAPKEITKEQINQWIDQIASLPNRLEQVVENISEGQLDTPYRPGGWTVRQVIHHIPDSHVNSYIRFKWVLTEDNPTIKAYTFTLLITFTCSVTFFLYDAFKFWVNLTRLASS